jgi:hypothetical protein
MKKSTNPHYVNDVDLLYEIILSKGKGYLTRNAEKQFILISERTMNRINHKYNDYEEKMDCFQHGQLRMFENWKNFDEKKFDKALPYVTEIFKRGVMNGWNEVKNKKYNQKEPIVMLSIESSNDGRGLHTI